MPKYLKNKRRRRHNFFKKYINNDIKMHSEYQESKKEKKTKNKKAYFKVLNGKKKSKTIRRIILLGTVFSVAISLLIISIFSPTGLSELYKNFSSTFSFKSYFPIELSGTETYAVEVDDNYFYLLSDTDFSVISNNGKITLKDNHGFSNPVMSKSETRCLLYDQNGNGVKIYNANENLINKNMDNTIYSGDISRNGTFAIAGKSDKFTSMVTVFDKNGDFLYEWFCPEENIFSVAVAPNGKSIAVATVKVLEGEFSSSIYILKFDSADPIFSKKYDGQLIIGINSFSKQNFAVVFENKCDIISWKNYSSLLFESDYDINFIKSNKKHTIIASSRENDDGNYKFSVYKGNKKLKTEFNFSGQVDDFNIKSNKIFILSGNSVYLINSDGNIAKKGDCGFGIIKIVPISSDSCLVIGHNSIAKITLQ